MSLPTILQVLIVLFAATKLLVRWWWFRPSYMRPGFVRHNETLRILDLLAVLALLAIFFLMVNAFTILAAVVTGIVLLGYDMGLRALFLHLETKRVCASSPKWSYREARRRVRSRARSSSAL